MSNPYTHVYVSRCDFMSSDEKKVDAWYEEVKRQTKLAESAPELLEALKAAIKTAEFENHPFRAWHEQARAAINKAEGKA